LCLGFSQITYNLPLRRTTLHLAQRFRMDGETFMISNLLTSHSAVCAAKVLIIYFLSQSVQRGDETASGLQDSQDERIAFGDRHTVFKVCGQ
jgi:hypothetical protein